MGGIGYFVVITKPGLTERLLGPFGSKREAQEEAHEHYLDQLPVGAAAAENLFWVDAMGEPTSATAGEWKYQIAPKKV